jgi:spermidine synthase
MIRWVQLDVARVPGGDGELRLMQRGAEFSIMAGAIELMNSRLSGSEEALASLACARVRARAQPQILVGGLGMGFTLRAALAALGPAASVTVAELVPQVIAWARGALAAVHGESLADPRVSVFEGDVRELIAGARSRYDAILLDVDNGPEGLMLKSNDELYDAHGLGEAHAALRPGGVLAVWSSAPNAAFTRTLQAVGYGVEETRVWAKGRPGGARHVIWLATKR